MKRSQERPPYPEEENAAPALSIDEARAFIESCTWTFAKTMPWAPHEYLVRRNVDNDKFVGLVKLIREKGERRKWGRYRSVYFDLDGWSYWTMGAPVAITIIVNRAKIGSTQGDPPAKAPGRGRRQGRKPRQA
jgi:hypothetical protein